MELVTLSVSDRDLLVPKDNVIFPILTERQYWDKTNLEFLASLLDSSSKYDFIDIGANVGLTSFFINQLCAIDNFHVIEPDTTNFKCLTTNLRSLKNCTFYNFALADKDGRAFLYKDITNSGNYSLFAPESNVKYTMGTVKTVSTLDFFKSLNYTNNLVIKCDTQKSDCVIINNIPRDVWEDVKLLYIEISETDNAILDSFVEKLKKFDYFYVDGELITLSALKDIVAERTEINLICGVR